MDYYSIFDIVDTKFLNLYRVSDIFNLNIKDYLINFIFIGVTYTFRVIINYGINKQEEYEQII